MSPQTGSWLSRLAERFNKRTNGNSNPADLPRVGDDGLLVDGVEMPDELGDDGESAAEKASTPLVRWGRRDAVLNRLQEGYDRLNQVVEEIQKHLAQQGERTDRICSALEQLARSGVDASSLGRHNAETLEAIAGHIEAGNARMSQVADAVGEIPKASRAQTDAINGIRKQMEMSAEQNLVTSQTMEKLSTAISTLGEVNTTQVEALAQMNRKADDQSTQLGKLIARQNKRFIMLFIVTMVLAAAAITAVILGLTLR
jgi:methyl-accepting chemotaxis protein